MFVSKDAFDEEEEGYWIKTLTWREFDKAADAIKEFHAEINIMVTSRNDLRLYVLQFLKYYLFCCKKKERSKDTLISSCNIPYRILKCLQRGMPARWLQVESCGASFKSEECPQAVLSSTHKKCIVLRR